MNSELCSGGYAFRKILQDLFFITEHVKRARLSKRLRKASRFTDFDSTFPRVSASSPSTDLIALAERLVTLRKRTAMRQYEVAKVLHMRAATLSDFEGGRAEPKLFQAVALADLYGVPLDVLIGRAPMPPAGRWPRAEPDA